MPINMWRIAAADAAVLIGPAGDTAEQITYGVTQIWAIVIRNKEVEKQVGLVISDATVYVLKADVANPHISDTLTFDGITYRVGSIDDYAPDIWGIDTNKWLGNG